MRAEPERVDDSFICRREGHEPTFKVTHTSGLPSVTYIMSCRRCGKVYEAEHSASQPPLARDPEWPDLPQEC